VGIRNGYKRQRARRMCVKMGLQIFGNEARGNFSIYICVCFFNDNVGIRNGYKHQGARRMCEQ